jgi:hypothetical protein
MPHALLVCSAFATERAAMWADLEIDGGGGGGGCGCARHACRQPAGGFAGGCSVGVRALAVDGLVREFLSVQFRR